MAEFKKTYTKYSTLRKPPKPISHLSKFIFFDQRSHTDDGNLFKLDAGKGALDEIGRISPYNWHWTPNGFYNNKRKLPYWVSHKLPELVDY